MTKTSANTAQKAEIRTTKDLYKLFDQERANLEKRTFSFTDKINVNRLEHEQLMKDHDQAVLAGNDKEVLRIREQAEKLDKEYGWLSREAELLSRAGPQSSPVLKDIANQWHELATAETNELKARWGDGLQKLDEAYHQFLQAVNVLGRIADECEIIQWHFNNITEITKAKLPWIDLPQNSIDCGLSRGPIFKDQKQVINTYQKGIKK